MAVLNGVDGPLMRHLEAGGNPNLADPEGRTLLWLAAARGRAAMCARLLASGASLDASASDGTTVLAAAMASGCKETLDLLSSLGGLSRSEPSTGLAGAAAGSLKEGVLDLEADCSGAADLDFDWESDPEPVEAPPPCEVGTVSAATIHSRISTSRVIEPDTSWDDVEIIFLTVRNDRVSYLGLDEEFLRRVAGILASAEERGEVPAAWVADCIGAYQGDFEEDAVEGRLRMLLTEHGSGIDESGSCIAGEAPEADPEGLGEDDLAFLACLGRDRFQELDPFYRNLWDCPLLSEEEERMAGFLWTCEGDDAGIQRLVRGNIRFVVKEARKYAIDGLEFGDVVGAGILGLYEAAKRYDPTRENRFLTFAAWWTRQSIMQVVIRHGLGLRFPSKIASEVSRFGWASRRLAWRQGYEPDPQEIAAFAGFTPEESASLEPLHRASRHESLDVQADTMPQPPDPGTPLTHAIQDSDAERLYRALEMLTEKERDIVSRHFGMLGRDEETLEEIGSSMVPPISRERVRQIEARALDRIRKRCPDLERLQERMPDFQWRVGHSMHPSEVEDDSE